MNSFDTARAPYPRPQMVRPEWASLDGWWEFAFDDANVGLSEHWFDGRELAQRILVPFPYQSTTSGIGSRQIHEVMWYSRSFELAPGWDSGALLLQFGAVDYRADVWINGRVAGRNRGGHVPFSFDIAPYLRAGSNRVTLRVEDRQDPYQPRGKQSSSGTPVRIYYYCTSGIWQNVWIEPVAPLHWSTVSSRMLARTRLVDATRPVIDNDGWQHTDVTDICTIHDYSHPVEALLERYASTRLTGLPPETGWHKGRALFLQGAQFRGQPIVFSEVGGYLLAPEGPERRRDRLYDHYGNVRNEDELAQRYQTLMEGLASLPFLAGLCYTQLTDVEHEQNGLLTAERVPRLPPEQLAELHQRLWPQA